MKKYLIWLLPLGWMGVIYYSSSTPYEDQDIKPLLGNLIDFRFLEPMVGSISFTYNQSVVSVDTYGINGFIEFFIRKGAHVTVFFLLTCFLYIAFRKTTSLTKHGILLASFLLTVLFAVSDEIHQGVTPNRTPYIGDVILDSIGAFAAVLCIYLVTLYRKKVQGQQ